MMGKLILVICMKRDVRRRVKLLAAIYIPSSFTLGSSFYNSHSASAQVLTLCANFISLVQTLSV